MPSALPRKIAPLWAIPKPAAPVAVVSNAPLATNGHASNPRRKSAKNTASPCPDLELEKLVLAKVVTVNIIIVHVILLINTPAPAPTKLEVQAKLVMANTLPVHVLQIIFGTIYLKNVNMITRKTVPSELCITATILAHKLNSKALKLCWEWLSMKKQLMKGGG